MKTPSPERQAESYARAERVFADISGSYPDLTFEEFLENHEPHLNINDLVFIQSSHRRAYSAFSIPYTIEAVKSELRDCYDVFGFNSDDALIHHLQILEYLFEKPETLVFVNVDNGHIEFVDEDDELWLRLKAP